MLLPFSTLVPLVLARLRATLNAQVPVHMASDYSRLAIGNRVFRVLTLLAATGLAEVDDAENSALPSLVIAEYIPHKTAQKLRQQGRYYADAMGNAWLETESPSLMLLLGGNRGRRLAVQRGTAFEPQGLRLLLQLLTDPSLLSCLDAELARRFHLLPAMVTAILLDLAEQGFLHDVGATRSLLRLPALALAWMTAYSSVLRPQLLASRYRWLPGIGVRTPWLEVARKTDCWLGGAAAARHLLSCSLIADPVTLYAHSAASLVSLSRVGLVVDPKGPVEVLHFFPAPQLLSKERCIHPLVVCADLLRHDSEASRQVTQLLLRQYMPHLVTKY